MERSELNRKKINELLDKKGIHIVAMGVIVPKNRAEWVKAFELAKALLGSTRFEALLAEAKGDALEGRPTSKTPNHRLMSRIMESLRPG